MIYFLEVPKLPPIDVEQGYDVVDVIQQIAQEHEASPAQVAIAWILTKPFISSVIVGANKMHQLKDNLKAANFTLSASEIDHLDALTAPPSLYPGWMQALGWDTKVKAAFDLDSKNQ